jgi:hypothetical protein
MSNAINANSTAAKVSLLLNTFSPLKKMRNKMNSKET